MLCVCLTLQSEDRLTSLFDDLATVEEIDEEINNHLPFIYNNVLLGGYFMMPSARIQKAGMSAIGGAYVPPYDYYNLNFQLLDILEFSGNYRIYRGVKDSILGDSGFGDFYDRGANFKLSLYKQSQTYKHLPSFAVGYEDFHGSRRFSSFYLIATKEWLRQNLEMTLGWGKGRMKGFFGGMGWTPWRKAGIRFIDGLTLIAEYDAFDYKSHPHEHPEGRSVRSRINVGLSARLAETLQLQVASVRGNHIGGSVTFNYNFGETKGFFPKIDNPQIYQAPLDLQALGHLRTEKELAQELACAFNGQGFALFQVYLTYGDNGEENLWLKVINTMYRTEEEVRERISYILSTLTPSNIDNITVVIEADALPIQEYHFSAKQLRRFRDNSIGEYELATTSPMTNVIPKPGQYDRTLLYRRKKSVWIFTFHPRFLTFLGSAKGKFKYSVGLVGGPEGYLFDQIYYKILGSYSIKSSFSDVGDMDKINPSQIINVRSDSVRYYQSNALALEQAFLQKGFNLGKGWFWRLATGYFEPAYAGVATEFLLSPVHKNWAIGLEGATVLKRNYSGLGFQHKIRKLNGFTPEYVPFVGYQYFLDLYYDFKPLQMDFKVSIGKFLARDKGARFEVTRYYPSGMRFSLWYTLTNANDFVNRQKYHDKGIAFQMPLDIFLKKSSRSMIGYAMSSWLRDIGARAATGIPLYSTVHWERI